MSLRFGLENVDELIELVNATSRDLESVIQVTGGETRVTMTSARQELSIYTAELNQYAGQRIAQLDAAVQAKLLWIQQYTEQVSTHIQEIIQVASQELQAVIGVSSQEAQNVLKTSGQVAQESVIVTSEELQTIIGLSSQEAQQIISRSEVAAQNTVLVTSQELQNVLGKTREESERLISTAVDKIEASTSNLLQAGGQVVQDSIVITSEELRYSILLASGETQKNIEKLSVESQSVISEATHGIEKVIESTTEGIDSLISTAEGSSLRLLRGSLYIVERGADLTLAIASAAAGLLFLFIAAYGWGKAILQWKIPESGLTRSFVMLLLVATFLAALLPFIFLSNTARAHILIPMDAAQIYAEVTGQKNDPLRLKPQVRRFEPSSVIVRTDGVDLPEELHVIGFGLLSYGYPVVRWGDHELAVTGTDTLLRIDLKAMLEQPQASGIIELRFGEDEDNTRRVNVAYVDPSPTPTATTASTHTPVPTFTPTTIATNTPSPTPSPTSTPTPTPYSSAVVIKDANVRSGPGGGYSRIGGAHEDEEFIIIGKSRDGNWWQISFQDREGWIYAQLVQATIAGDVLVVDRPHRPFPTSTPKPTSTPTARPHSNSPLYSPLTSPLSTP